MVLRRVVLAMAVVTASGAGFAQQASGFVGQWQGTVDGVGDIKMTITGVKPDGKVEGRMEFAMHSFVSTFGDTASNATSTNLGTVSGSTLTIEAALGGTYRLALSGNALSGRYTRGSTFDGAASFRRL
jgi:hypothetical protein